MPFQELMTDNVELVKADGTKTSGLRASIQGNKVFMNAGKLVIEQGDLIIRKMSTGAEERYTVVEPGFYEAFHAIPANYQMTVRKLEKPPVANDDISEQRRTALFAQWEKIGVDFIKGDLMAGGFGLVGGPPSTRQLAREWVRMKEEEQKGHSYSVQVSGPNARVNIHSTDQSVNTVVGASVFGEMRQALDDSIASNEDRTALRKLVDEMEAARDRDGFLSRYQAFIGAAANHMTVIAPFLPALAELLKNFAS